MKQMKQGKQTFIKAVKRFLPPKEITPPAGVDSTSEAWTRFKLEQFEEQLRWQRRMLLLVAASVLVKLLGLDEAASLIELVFGI